MRPAGTGAVMSQPSPNVECGGSPRNRWAFLDAGPMLSSDRACDAPVEGI
jgi:hypothetical protein